MVDTSPILAGPILVEGQYQVTQLEERLTRMEPGGAGGYFFQDFTLNTPPTVTAADDGKQWLVGSSPTGAWSTFADKIVVLHNAGTQWLAIDPALDLVAPTGLVKTGAAKWAKARVAFNPNEGEWHPAHDIWSTAEYWTGRYGSGGTKLYSKCFVLNLTRATAGTEAFAHSITSLDLNTFIWWRFSYRADAASTVTAQVHNQAGTLLISPTVNATNIVVTTDGNMSSFTMDIRLFYERT